MEPLNAIIAGEPQLVSTNDEASDTRLSQRNPKMLHEFILHARRNEGGDKKTVPSFAAHFSLARIEERRGSSLFDTLVTAMTCTDYQDQTAHSLFSQTNTGGFTKAPQSSTCPGSGVNNIAHTDGRSEICVSPSWQTDRERRERKKELKRIAKEKKELERSSKSEPKKTDQSPFSEPRRLTKKQPVKTPSRASSIRSILPHSSTAPSILGFLSNSTSKTNSVREKTDHNTSTLEMGGDGAQDSSLEPIKPLFTGHLPQRFGGRINRDPTAYDKTSSRALDSDSSPSIPLSPSDIPRRHLHVAKKHSDLRAAARASRSSDLATQNANTAPTRSSWSQELTRRLSNSNGNKLRRRSLKAEHEPHMYSLRRGSTNKVNENGTKSGQKTEKSVPSTPTSGHFHATTGISSPSPQNSSRITIVQPDEKIIPPQNTTNQQDCEAITIQSTVNDANCSSEQEQSTVSVISPSSSPQKTTHKPAENQRKHGRRHSWSEILNNSDRVAGVSLKRRGQGREPLQRTANGDVHEFKTSGPYESNFAPNGIFKSHAAKSDPSITPTNWHVTAENIGIAGDFPQVQPQTESLPNTILADLPLDPVVIQKTTVVTDPLNIDLVTAAPSVKQRENPMRMAPKIISRDVPFKSSPLAGPPLNNPDDEGVMEPGKLPKQGGIDASFKSKDEKAGFSFSRMLRHGSKKEKNSVGFGRRYSMKASMLVNPPRKAKEPKAPTPGSNVLQKQQDTDDKAASKSSSSAEVKPEVTSRPPASAFARQYNLVPPTNNDKTNDIKIPPKSPKRNSGMFPTPASTRPSSASGVEIMSTSSNGTETPGKKKRSISEDITKSHVPSTQFTAISSSFASTKQPTTNPPTSSDSHIKTSERYHQIPPGPIYDSRPGSSSRHSLANSLANGRAAAQRPARRGTPVAKMFVICCQCRYWHDMPSDIYAKLAFPNGIPPIEPIVGDDSHSPLYQPHLPMASSGFASHGGGSSSTFTETSSGASNHALDNKSPRGSRPSSSSSSSSNNFMVTCCWCAHRMVKTCCAGWTTIVYLHERHH